MKIVNDNIELTYLVFIVGAVATTWWAVSWWLGLVVIVPAIILVMGFDYKWLRRHSYFDNVGRA